MMEKSVVLPAPFGPMSPVMHPVVAVSEAEFTASKPPKRQDTRSTDKSCSAIRRLGFSWTVDAAHEAAPHAVDDADQAARRESDHYDQDTAINNEIESWRVTCHELGRLSQSLHHQGAEQRTENGAGAADDRRQQRLDRHPCAI